MTQADSVLSLSVNGRFSFQLGRRGFAGTMPNLRVKMNDASNTATLVMFGYDSSTNSFSLPSALQNGVFNLVDVESNTKIDVPLRKEEPGELVVQSKVQSQWFDLVVDGQDEFWKQVLIPGHKYEVRWKDGPNAPWAFRGKEHQDSPKRLPVHHFSSAIELVVFGDDSTQPQLSISLAPTAKICHLNGEPRFGFELQIISHNKDVLTVCLDKTPLKELYSLGDIAHTVDEDNKQEVEWPESIGCWGDDDPFPADYLFEEFKPGVPYNRKIWLSKYVEDTANGGELEALDPGRSYMVNVSKTLIETTFTMWLRGRKEELLAGTMQEKRARWNVEKGPVLLEVSEPFKFATI